MIKVRKRSESMENQREGGTWVGKKAKPTVKVMRVEVVMSMKLYEEAIKFGYSDADIRSSIVEAGLEELSCLIDTSMAISLPHYGR